MRMKKSQMKKSKFYRPTPFKEQVVNFFKSLLFWKGRKRGMVHTMNIKWDHVRAVFFPKNFYEKYHYLGSIPWNEEGDIFQAMEPLVIFMDSKAKPWWCPRWFLRFLHLFGNDNSLVRVRNRFWSDLSNRITKGYMIWDYKTKWYHYDLRISVQGNEQMNWLADAIEDRFYRKGRREDLLDQLKELNPEKDYSFKMLTELEEEVSRLHDKS
jgi:hypothetical protein